MITMKISSENKEGRTVIKSENKNHTIMNLMRKYLWKNGTDSGYDEGHPYLGGSKLIVDSENVEEDIETALKDIRSDLKAFKESFKS